MKKQWLICVDSDGCAMDTMTIKHVKCFGPCIIKVWGLEEFAEPILESWNKINLYSNTRGINRFRGLQLILTEINDKYQKIEGIENYCDWCMNTTVFSETALEKTIVEQRGIKVIGHSEENIMDKVLEWSRMVNREIDYLKAEEKVAFEGVKEAISEASKYADIAVVSSANAQAVKEEWERCGLIKYVDYLMTQDIGTKENCLEKLLSMKYEREQVLLLGDAPGDYVAAEKSGVLFYPILAGSEVESWKEFRNTALIAFIRKEYQGEYSKMKIRDFKENLQ